MPARITRIFVIPALLCCVGSTTAQTRDPLTLAPKDTIAFFGWTAPDASTRQRCDALFELAEAVVRGVDRPGSGFVVEVVPIVKMASRYAGFLALLDMKAGASDPQLHIAAIVEAGADAPKLQAALQQLAKRLHREQDITQTTIDGVAFTVVKGAGPSEICLGVKDGRVILTYGRASAQKILATAGDALSQAPEVQFHRQRLRVEADSIRYCMYVDFQRLANGLSELVDDPEVDATIQQMGLKSFISQYVHADRKADKQRTLTSLHLGPGDGLCSSLYLQEPLSEADLRIIPASAHWAVASNIDLHEFWTRVRGYVGQVDSDALPRLDAAIAGAQAYLGFSPTDDLLSAFGDTWILYDAPENGGLIFTGAVLVGEVRDRDRLEPMLGRLVEVAAGAVSAASEGEVALDHREIRHEGHAIHYLMVAGAPVPVAPAWTIVGDRLILGLTPHTVANVLPRVTNKPEASLLDNANYKAAIADLDGAPSHVSYVDTGALARLLHPAGVLATTAAASFAGKDGPGVSFGIMPLFQPFLASFSSAVAVAGPGKAGPMSVQIGDDMTIAAVAAIGLGAGILLPSLHAARDAARGAVWASNLRQIGTACHVYASQNQDRFPDNLEALVVGGMIGPRVLDTVIASDVDNPEPAIWYISGQTSNSDQRNVLAFPRSPAARRVPLLFVDGHVELYDPQIAVQVIQATYSRLNRSDEMPELDWALD